MAELVNLNKARKARARAETRSTAAANRVVFGRTKAEKAQARQEQAQARRTLDGARRDET